jgi:hypothetical protein
MGLGIEFMCDTGKNYSTLLDNKAVKKRPPMVGFGVGTTKAKKAPAVTALRRPLKQQPCVNKKLGCLWNRECPFVHVGGNRLGKTASLARTVEVVASSPRQVDETFPVMPMKVDMRR